MMGVPRFPGPGPWNMPYGGGNNGFGGGQNHNGYNHGGGNHNGFGNDHWNDFGGFGYPMEVGNLKYCMTHINSILSHFMEWVVVQEE